jgi:phosphatidylglycerol:prolipoprotein diacylglycerol transferase
MSFHGGALGVIVAIIVFARQRKIPMLALGDIVCAVVPIGLFFGRIANFINGELFGRVSDVPWAMVFPNGGPEPRHPSQLYQAGLEGLALFAVLAVLAHRTDLRQRPGLISGVFLCGYAIARSIGELFREPDAHLGFLIGAVTMGQLLSLPMLIAGIWLIATSGKRPLLPLTKQAA